MPRFFAIDTGGTARLVQRFIVIDPGGTAREIKRAFVIDSGGTARLFFSGAVLTLPNTTVSDSTFAPTNPIARFILNSNGNRQEELSGGVVNNLGAWVTPTTLAGNYEARATLISGTFTSSTFGSWLSLGTSRSWGITRSTNGTSVASMTLEIREAATGTVVASATISFSATRDP